MVTVMPPFLLLGLCQTRLPRLIFFLCVQITAAMLVLTIVHVDLLPAPQFVPLGNNFAYDVINSQTTRLFHFFRHVLPNTSFPPLKRPMVDAVLTLRSRS